MCVTSSSASAFDNCQLQNNSAKSAKQQTVKMSTTGGQRMKYPYTVMGKFFNYPWKWAWKNGRGLRYTAYAAIITLPIFWKVTSLVNSPASVRMWTEIRQARLHDHFEAPHE